MASGSVASSTVVPSSSVTVTGNAAAGDGLGWMLGAALAEPAGDVAGADEGSVPGAEQAANRTDSARDRATPRRRKRGDTAGFLRCRVRGPEGPATHAEPLASRRIEGGVRGWCARSCL